MVYYAQYKFHNGWCIPVHMKPRDLYDMGDTEGSTMSEADVFETQDLLSFDVISFPLYRVDVVTEFKD